MCQSVAGRERTRIADTETGLISEQFYYRELREKNTKLPKHKLNVNQTLTGYKQPEHAHRES